MNCAAPDCLPGAGHPPGTWPACGPRVTAYEGHAGRRRRVGPPYRWA
jgi:hypothetical protein